MYLVEMDENQLNNVRTLLDAELKRNGLSSLSLVVDLYNAVMAAIQRGEYGPSLMKEVVLLREKANLSSEEKVENV